MPNATAQPRSKWHRVQDSAHIGKFMYLPEQEALLMQFHNGSVYEWKGITQRVWEGLIRCDERGESVGTYFHRYVDNGKHPSKQIL